MANGKFYIGKHSTKSLDDGYKGSTIHLYYWNSRKKYGEHNFTRFEISFFETSEEAFSFERSLLTNDMIESNDCYNTGPGGNGWISTEAKKAARIARNNNKGQNGFQRMTPEQRSTISRIALDLGKNPFQQPGFASAASLSRKTFGFQGMSPEKRSAISSLGAKSQASRGATPFQTGVAQRSPNHPSQKTATCPHCGVSSQALTMYRWHFDKCRMKP